MFNSPTIASILSGFTKQVKQLEDLSEREADKAIKLDYTITDLETAKEAATKTAHDAYELANRIKSFTQV